jgi:uncharacterized membrane protein YfcA
MNAAQIFLYVALCLAGIAFAIGAVRAAPRRNDKRWPTPIEVILGLVTDFFDTLGIGSFLLDMNPIAAFPIMMGACALLQPVASLRFFQTGAFAWGPSLGLAFGGVIGVLVAAFIVKSLPLWQLRWLVIVVVWYAAFALLRSAGRRTRAE